MNKVIYDTGPLFDFILVRCIDEYRWISLKDKISFLKNKDKYNIFSIYLKNSIPIYITPSVIVELYNLGKQKLYMHNNTLEKYLSLTKKELIQLGVSEQMIELAQMPDEVFTKYGPTDTSLIVLAEQMKKQNDQIDIITGELDNKKDNLYYLCRERNISVKSIFEIIN